VVAESELPWRWVALFRHGGIVLCPFLDEVPLCGDRAHVSGLLTVATGYAQRFSINHFRIFLVTNTTYCNGKIACGTHEQKDVHVVGRHLHLLTLHCLRLGYLSWDRERLYDSYAKSTPSKFCFRLI
jgi:hypothetical protein